ncbi:MAG: AraC family transcriptional regulator [Actinomycetota bacterium]
MASYRQHTLEAPVHVDYEPDDAGIGLPYEVLDRSRILAKKSVEDFDLRQRPGFHQLVVCTGGGGSHVVDFEPVRLRRGSVLKIHPGQVQRFVADQRFDATMIVWPLDSQRDNVGLPDWLPGSDTPTRWELGEADLDRLLGWLADLAAEQADFDGTPAGRELLLAVLHAFLLRLKTALPNGDVATSRLPRPYLDLRTAIEADLYERPTVSALAAAIGYSTRTLDRACDFVVGRTAKQVLDERIALEVRRLLTHTDRSVASIGADFGFTDPSNFSKFVKRQLGQPPSTIRHHP